ncbi:MAG: phosphoribosylaminoimidazolesuccinocarboxamide synthase [Bacteroidales bacterium]|nr:phosphoribosylaminoimidazolesuccinocarboxamide synthase [Bacteroidales bacterium]
MTITATNFNFKNLKKRYQGKVRDVYHLENDLLIIVVTDRISAFDVILPQPIPYKGQVLNQIANIFLDATADIAPNWKIAMPDPNVTIGFYCQPIPIEIIVRGYLTGSSWREYKNGIRNICGNILPSGMREHEKFPSPIITPTTKAIHGHDVNISKNDILKQGILTENEYEEIEHIALSLFERGSKIAEQRGLILVDTKYEFGKKDGKIFLIDEIHTPDSSRYFYAEDYEERFSKGLSPRQLSKEFVREWLMENGFMGQPNQQIPEMTDKIVQSISERYIELYEKLTGKAFVKYATNDIHERIKQNIVNFLETHLF